MNKDHSKIIDDLENAVIKLDKEDFFYDFLNAYGIPKATITGLRKNTNGRNIGFDNGDIGFKNKIYFRACDKGANLQQELEKLKSLKAVINGKVRLLVVTDFEEVAGYDLKANELLAEIELSELHKQYAFFLPLAGYEKAVVYSDHPADVKASEKLGLLFDLILKQNHIEDDEDKRHAINVFLTRLLFCFYAEDTGIFKEGQMSNAIANTTQSDGSDLDQFFATLFKVLNTPKDDAFRKKLPTHLSGFEYVNGGLFASEAFIPKFGKKSRRVILESGSLDWKKINPDIFGSMFQSVVDPKKRGSLGQHYTSVPNIMKVIQPLFLDKLYEELEKSKGNVKKLEALIMRLERIRVFDPACGSGNFLIIAYKELRRFEMEVFKALNEASGQDVLFMSGIKLSQFYGIEIDDFAHEIALLSLWLTEHQMNVEFRVEFGYTEPTLPLRDAGNIRHGNSLRIDWEDFCPKSDDTGELEVYICGNPPFLGTTDRTREQKEDMEFVFGKKTSIGYLDFVGAWFYKASDYINSTSLKCAFVATNSICQGDQVSILWNPIFKKGVVIDFAFKTFSWQNSAKDKAAVHVVIIGLRSKFNQNAQSRIYETLNDKIVTIDAEVISPYLMKGLKTIVEPRTSPIAPVSKMIFGNKPTDGGNLYLTNDEKEDFFVKYPDKSHWIRKILGAAEFLNGGERWCFWLPNIPLEEVMETPETAERCRKVEALRTKAGHPAALKAAKRSHTFIQLAQPKSGNYLLVPRVSSERRTYVPMGYFGHEVISSDANQMIPNATLYEFGVLTSEMHNDWMRTVAGRLKSDYRYSATLVYNTFPWPEVNDEQKKQIESLAKEIILIRQDYELEGLTLANMYDPDKMPKDLLAAHKALDKAVEKLYRDKPFKDASERLEFLFARYEELVKLEKQQC